MLPPLAPDAHKPSKPYSEVSRNVAGETPWVGRAGTCHARGWQRRRVRLPVPQHCCNRGSQPCTPVPDPAQDLPGAVAHAYPKAQPTNTISRAWKIWLVCGDCFLIGAIQGPGLRLSASFGGTVSAFRGLAEGHSAGSGGLRMSRQRQQPREL